MPPKGKTAKRKVSARQRTRATSRVAPRKMPAAKKAAAVKKSAVRKRKPVAKAVNPKSQSTTKVARKAAAPRRATAATSAVSLLDGLIARARKSGADAADAVLVDSTALSVAQRMGKPEKLERAESRDLGLRVFIGKRQAIVSTTDTSPTMLDGLVERAIAMARTVPICARSRPRLYPPTPLSQRECGVGARSPCWAISTRYHRD